MKICIVTEFCKPYYNGGGEIRYHEIAKRLVKKGHIVDLVCCRFTDAPKQELVDGVLIHHVGPLIKNPPNRSIFNFVHYITACFRFLMKHKYDILDSNTFFPLLPSFIAGKFTKTPVVATINIFLGDWTDDIYNPRIASLIEKLLFKLKYDNIITVSEYAKNELSRIFNIDNTKIVVVHNGIDFDEIDNIKIEKRDEKTIIYVGRLVWFKYIDDLITALSLVKEQISDIKLKIIGTGQKMDEARSLVEQLRLSENVSFLGSKSHKETLIEIKKSTVLALPSTKDTFGIVLVEANACGIPVVAYETGGAVDIIKDGYNGIFVEPRNIEKLSDKLCMLIKDNVLNNKLGDNGKHIAKTKFSWDMTADKIEKVYLDTITK